MKKLHDLFEDALRDWHDDLYAVKRKPDLAEGVYLWHVIDRETGQICRIYYDSHLQQFDCGRCRHRSMVDGHCRHSLLVRINTYVTAYEKDRPDESRRAVVATAIEAVREKLGLTDTDPESTGEEELDAVQRLLHDEELYLVADEVVVPWEGAFYGASLLDLTETAEGRAYLQSLATRESDDTDDLRRHADELIRDAAQRVHAAVCTTYADGGAHAAAA